MPDQPNRPRCGTCRYFVDHDTAPKDKRLDIPANMITGLCRLDWKAKHPNNKCRDYKQRITLE